MYLIRLLLVALTLVLCACGTGDQPATTADATEPAAEPVRYELIGAETDLRFVIVSNSAGPVTVRFPGGLEGALGEDGKGSFSIQLDTFKSLDQNNLENPLRDSNTVEAFFGVRPSAIFPAEVDAAWEKLTGKLERSVAKAQFEVTESDLIGSDAANGTLSGNLKLWNTVSVPLSFPVSVTRAEGRVEFASTAPVAFDLEEVLGSDLRKLTFDTMLAAGCAHQPGIQNKVEITLDRVVLARK